MSMSGGIDIALIQTRTPATAKEALAQLRILPPGRMARSRTMMSLPCPGASGPTSFQVRAPAGRSTWLGGGTALSNSRKAAS